MWISQALAGLLFIIATTQGFKADTYQGQAPKSIIPSDAFPIPRGLFIYFAGYVMNNQANIYCGALGGGTWRHARDGCAGYACFQPVRESRSSIFWTGSRYNRRGSDGMKKMVKQRADRFYMGSRYGKRADPSQPEFDTDLCKFSSFHSLYPCARYR